MTFKQRKSSLKPRQELFVMWVIVDILQMLCVYVLRQEGCFFYMTHYKIINDVVMKIILFFCSQKWDGKKIIEIIVVANFANSQRTYNNSEPHFVFKSKTN